jgi:tetratricopeptide (TPR) repeat protein
VGPLVSLAAALLLAGCALPRAEAEHAGQSLRISELAERGDPTRRASLRLIDLGLAADEAGQPEQALDHYERAIRVDPTNPFAYLVLARYWAELGEAERSLELLDQAEGMLGGGEPDAPRVDAHVLGLRGSALVIAGRSSEGQPLLERAAQLAPSIWGDGSLSAAELR